MASNFHKVQRGLLILILSIGHSWALAEGEWVEGKPNYYEIKPAITVNLLEDEVRFVQLKVQLMSREVATLDAIEKNKPALVDRLLQLISQQSAETMTKVKSREEVRKQALLAMQDALSKVSNITTGKRVGKGEEAKTIQGIEAVYFTDLVIQ